MNAQSQKKFKKNKKLQKKILDFEDFWVLWRSGRKSKVSGICRDREEKVSGIMVSGFSRLKIGEG
jgi:hypothetical protein